MKQKKDEGGEKRIQNWTRWKGKALAQCGRGWMEILDHPKGSIDLYSGEETVLRLWWHMICLPVVLLILLLKDLMILWLPDTSKSMQSWLLPPLQRWYMTNTKILRREGSHGLGPMPRIPSSFLLFLSPLFPCFSWYSQLPMELPQ